MTFSDNEVPGCLIAVNGVSSLNPEIGDMELRICKLTQDTLQTSRIRPVVASGLKTLSESDVAEAGRRIPDCGLTIVHNYLVSSPMATIVGTHAVCNVIITHVTDLMEDASLAVKIDFMVSSVKEEEPSSTRRMA
uniref:Uncharacterized protein n=1 Tax=Magallana gigas TaxID=29159 RepID=K1Q1R0_MAGGI